MAFEQAGRDFALNRRFNRNIVNNAEARLASGTIRLSGDKELFRKLGR